MTCEYSDVCSGCSLWQTALQQQQKEKVELFKTQAEKKWQITLPEVKIHSLGPGGLRDRLDFTIENGSFGLQHKTSSQIVDLPVCLQLSPPLQKFLEDFRSALPPVKKGSVRLRVGPNGERGVWLDFANKDIQMLFEEKTALTKLLALGFVEIGQRRKKLIWSESSSEAPAEIPRFRLVDPELQTWTSAYVGPQQKELDLYSYVSSFSQTGTQANKKIAEIITSYVSQINPNSIYEFGAGIGTLTLPALFASATQAAKYTVFENDELSLQGLKKTLEQCDLAPRIQINAGDFQKEKIVSQAVQTLEGADLLILNPPRSGVGDFLVPTVEASHAAIYMSCFAQSLIEDAKLLIAMGFKLKQVELVDQFPQTSHGEWLALWEK